MKDLKKIIAAVVAFAMVAVAGFAIVGVTDDADADITSATVEAAPAAQSGIITLDDSRDNDKKYLITEDVKIFFDHNGGSSTPIVNLYVKTGVTLTAYGEAGNVLKFNVYVVTSDADVGTITIDKMADVMATFGALTESSEKTISVYATPGTAAVPGVSSAVIGNGYITTDITASSATYNFKYQNATSGMTTFYSKGGVPNGIITGSGGADEIRLKASSTGINLAIKDGSISGTTFTLEDQVILSNITVGSKDVTFTLGGSGIVVDSIGSASTLSVGTVDVSKGSMSVGSVGINIADGLLKGVVVRDSGTSGQYASGDIIRADITKDAALTVNELVLNKSVSGNVIVTTSYSLTIGQGASFTGTVVDNATAASVTSSVGVTISTLPSGSSVVFIINSDKVQMTPTATTINAVDSSTVIGSYLELKSFKNSTFAGGDATTAIALADGFGISPTTTTSITLDYESGVIIIPKDNTITLGDFTSGTTGKGIISTGTIYVFGSIDGTPMSGKLAGTTVYSTSENNSYVKTMRGSNPTPAKMSDMGNSGSGVTYNVLYALTQAQTAGWDISTTKAYIASGVSEIKTTVSGGTATDSNPVVDITLDGFNGTIASLNTNGTAITVLAKSTFTVSNETTLRAGTNALTMTLKNGSELVIKDSNLLMEVTKEDKADVKVTVKTMELTNPSGNIEVGYMREAIVSGDINGSSVTVYGNMTIAGTAKISSGSTVNVYKGGNLSVEGSLTVEGTVNFNKGSTGSISGTMTIGMPNAGASVNVVRSNVTVTETGTVKVIAPNAKGISEGRTNTLDISASVTPIYNEPASGTVTPNPDGKLDNTPYMFTVLGTLNMNGTLKADNIYDMGTITINGTVSDFRGYDALVMDTEEIASGNSKITTFDGVSIVLTSVVGTLKVTDDAIMAEAERPLAKLASGNTVTVQNVRGVTVSEAVSAESYTSGSNTYRVYVSYMTVSGTFSEAIETGTRQVVLGGSATGPTGSSINGGILITDDVIVGKNVKLESSAKVKMSGTITVVADQAELSLTGGMMTVTGTITVKNGNQLANEVSSGSEAYIAAAKSYVLDAATAVYTYTYTTFENAISTVLSAENKTVDVLGTVTVSESTDIPAEAVVEISGKLVIGKNAIVVAKERSSINGAQISVSGSFTSEDYINDLDVDKIDADVVSTKDASRTWTSLAKAIDGATEGSVITTSKAVEVGNLTIPAGVTVTTEYNITVKKNSIIAVDGTLTVNKGTIIQNDATGADVKGSIVIGENGVVSVVDAAPDIFIDVAGAHFQKLIGAKDYFFVTNVAYAAANADSKIVGGNIDIYGEVAMGDITFTKAADADSLNIRLKKTTDTDLLTAVSGNISLVNGTTFSAEEKVVFSGTVSVDSLATMAFQKVEGVSIVKYIDNSASTPVEYALINTNSAKGSLVFESGTSYIGTGALATGSIVTNSNFDVTVGAEAKLVVPQNGTVTVGTSAKADKSTFVVEGTLDVVKGKVTVNSNGIMDVLGTVNISETPANTKGVFIDGIMNVLGTVNVSDESTKTGYLKVNGIIAVGSKPTDLGASGAIDGTVVTGTAAGYVKIYSGEVGAVKVDTLDAEPTVVTINGEKYMTLLGKGDVKSILVAEDIDLEGLKGYVSGTTKIYSDEAMTQEIIGSFNIGYYDAIYFELDTAQVDLYVSVGTALTLWIDGERYLNNTSGSYKLDVGTHDVKVIIDPNYQGTITITFNGQTITNGKIVVTTDMIGERNVLSATGDLTIIPGEEPAPVEPTKDDGMGITEYLLIVLVVLAAILVVVVAIRMMRS